MAFRTRPVRRTSDLNSPFKTREIGDRPVIIQPKKKKTKKERSKSRINRSHLIKGFGWLMVAVTAAGFGYLIFIFSSLPSLDKLREGSFDQSTKVFDRNGELLYEIHGATTGRRTVVSLSEISPNFTNALMAAEDDDFYSHNGFDWRGFIQGAILNPLTGKRMRGGSTLTQQLIKNVLLTPERSVNRKARELVLALMAEREFTKDELLEMYSNQMAFGSNAYGVAAAAKTFFGKKATELSIHEGATLAAILRAPTLYSPYGSNAERLISRRDWIIERMAGLDMITDDEMVAAQNEPLGVVPYLEDIEAPHFVMMVKEDLVDRYGEEVVERGGLTVYTTLDSRLQEFAEEAMAERREYNTDYYDATNAALVAVNPDTSEVLSMVGSYDYFDQEIDGAVNVSTRLRQPGSSIKPFAYAAAFLKGYSPATVVYDVRTNFSEGGAKYEPGNYDGQFRGPVSLRNALAQSLNIPAVKTLFLAGIPETINLAHQMGITSLNEIDRYGLSLVLGGGETMLIDMVEAYTTIATGGIHRDLQYLRMVQDRDGQILYEMDEDPDEEEVFSPEVAYLVTSILSDNVARTPMFGAESWLNLGTRPAAVKTGTTNEYRDAWTIGYTPSLVVGVWGGNNDNHEMKNRGGGAGVAGPIWNLFMKKALKDTPIERFDVPPGVRFVEVSGLSGKIPSRFTPLDNIVKEVFLKENVPVEEDDFYTSVQVNSLDGLLANKWCPKGAVENLIYENFHSIRADKASWESAVQRWASWYTANRLEKIAQGEDVGLPVFGAGNRVRFVSSLADIPTEGSPLCTEEIANMPVPALRVTSPSDLARVSPGQLDVTASVTSTARPIEKVEFYLDGQIESTIYDSRGIDGRADIYRGFVIIPEGDEDVHRLKVVAYDDLLHTSEVTLSIESMIDKYPPKIEIVSPPDGSTVFWNTRTNLNFSVHDKESEIGRVEIYLDQLDDDHLIGAIHSAPYSFELFATPDYPEGEHTLIARAFDTQGNFAKTESTVTFQNPIGEDSTIPGEKIGAIISPTSDDEVTTDIRIPIIAKFRSLRYVDNLSFYAQHLSTNPRLLEQFDPENNEKYLQTTWEPDMTGEWQLWFRATFTNGKEVESDRVRVQVR